MKGEESTQKKMSYRWFDTVLAMAWASRWRKAYKCKRVIRRLKQRIALQKSRMNAIIRQARCDVAQLLQNGQLQVALSKVDQLHSDQCRLAAYNQLLEFCDCILTNLSGFSMHSKFSDEGREAASSIIYASARCSELPELQSLRDLFKQHFGKAFERINVQLLPGNTVNSQTKQNLTRKPAMEDIKLQLTDEIANEYAISLGPQLKLLARENYIASCELKKKDEPEGGLSKNESKRKSSRTLKLQGILQKIRSNTTLTSSRSVAEKDFYPSSTEIKMRRNNKIDPSFKISSNASVSIQGKGIVPDEKAEEAHRVEDPCSCSGQHSSSKRYPDKVIDQRHNHMLNKDASYAQKERNVEVQDSHIIDNDQKNPVTHVHPKLPDYDRLAARFEDLKRQNAKDQPLTKWMR